MIQCVTTLYALKVQSVSPKVIKIIQMIMSKWRTSIFINSKTKTDPIPITNGIFQGYSLCPLLFCLSINLIGIYISLINNPIVFTNGTILSHRLYIDYFKLYPNDGDSL
ncbi:hypothetical protein ACTFIY_001620 [Dictyostelium cf. discoideum]